MRKPKLIHCSFDLVTNFIPRVPDSIVKCVEVCYEDSTTPRICTAPSILSCLKAMPKAGEIIRWMQAVGLKPIVHAYYLESDNIHTPTTDEVMDADVTHEMWILDKPKDWHRRDYEIISCSMTEGKDIFGKNVFTIHGCEIKQTCYTDNLQNLVEGLGLEYGDFMRQFPYVNFRDMAMNIKCTDELREKRKKHLHHKNFESLQRRIQAYKETSELVPTDITKERQSSKIPGNWFNHGGKERQKNRAKTFPGIAKAMAEQWR